MDLIGQKPPVKTLFFEAEAVPAAALVLADA
jgi:hypothetical protein